MQRRTEHVMVRMSDGNAYTGEIHLLDHTRVHDLLNSKEAFIALKGARRNSNEPVHWILLNREHIVSVEPPPGNESGEYRQPGFTNVLRKSDGPGAGGGPGFASGPAT